MIKLFIQTYYKFPLMIRSNGSTLVLNSSTTRFTTAEPQNQSINVSELHKSRRSILRIWSCEMFGQDMDLGVLRFFYSVITR